MARMELDAIREDTEGAKGSHTAVVIACVASGAVLSFI
jgi:hypothetical protein